MRIIESLDRVTGILAGVGLTAGPDTDTLQAPCAWVRLDKISGDTLLNGDGELQLEIFLIAPDNAYLDAIEQLQGMLRQALSVISPDGEIDLDAGVQTSAGVLPAFKIPLTVKVEA
jgi:hypothetical protein